MYLRTPKRYQPKARRRFLVNLRWLWLYLLAPVVLVPLLLVWNYRGPISDQIAQWTARNVRIDLNPPTPTATIPAADLRANFVSYVQAGNINNAVSTLSSLADTAPNDVALHALLAQMILLRGDPSDPARQAAGLRAAQGALNANPEAPEGWVMVALALNNAGKPQQAIPYLMRARDLDAKNPMMLAVLGEAYNRLDRVEDAQRLIEEAINLAKAADPVNITALAYAHVVRGNLIARESGSQAIRDYEEAWRVALTDPMVPVGFIAQWIAGYYLNTPDNNKLIDILTQARNRDKDDATNFYLLGRVYLNRGDSEQARTNFEQCRDKNPDYVKCLRWLGTVLFRSGNYTRAAELGQRAVDLNPKDADDAEAVHLIAGLSYANLNRCSEAVPLLRKGLEIDLNDPNESLRGNRANQFQEGLRLCGTVNAPPAAPTATTSPSGG